MYREYDEQIPRDYFDVSVDALMDERERRYSDICRPIPEDIDLEDEELNSGMSESQHGQAASAESRLER